MSDHPKWNFDEFKTFLLVYAASADFVLSPEEEKMIKDKIDPEICEKVCAEYDQMNDYEVIQTILCYKEQYYSTSEKKDQLLELMKKQFLSDGVFSQVEKNLLLVLRRVL